TEFLRHRSALPGEIIRRAAGRGLPLPSRPARPARLPGRSGEEAVELVLDGPVALAGGGLQAAGVRDRYLAPPVLDQAALLQGLEHFRDAGAAHAEHDGQ